MPNALRHDSGTGQAIAAATIIFLLSSCAMVFWLVTNFDRAVPQLTESLSDLPDMAGSTIDHTTIQRVRLGIFALGTISILFVIGLALAYSGLSQRQRRLVMEVFRQALDSDSADDDKESEDENSDLKFDGSLDSARRLGRAMRSQQLGRTIDQARLSKLANLMDVGVLLFDADLKPALASAAALRLLACTEPLPSPAMVDRIFKAFESENGDLPDQAKAELEVTGESQKAVHLSLRLFHLDENCDQGFLILVRDQRVLKDLETDLRLATQLRAMSRLYLGVAHDLKAPLNAIGLNLSLLRDSFAPTDSEEDQKRSRWLEVLDLELKRLRRETERLLTQTAPSREEVSDYDLGALLTRIRSLLVPQAKQQLARVELTLPEKRVMVRGHEDLVHQALLNIAINALEATPEGKTMHLSLACEEKRAFIRIRDEGLGIPEANQQHIFEIHFTTKEHGTGIGLYIARSILEAEGGTLVLQSTSGGGTILEVTLPLI